MWLLAVAEVGSELLASEQNTVLMNKGVRVHPYAGSHSHLLCPAADPTKVVADHKKALGTLSPIHRWTRALNTQDKPLKVTVIKTNHEQWQGLI